MTKVATPAGYTNETHEAFINQRSSPGWLNDIRRAAWKSFTEMSWPARSSEEWSRTDYRSFKLDKFQPNIETGTSASTDLTQVAEGVLANGVREAGDKLAGQVASSNGTSLGSSIDQKWVDRGVIFGGLEEVASEHGEMVKEHLMQRAFQPDYDRFAALHTAFLSTGAVLFVPRNVTIDEPIHIRSELSDQHADFGHLLIVLEEGAEATVMAESSSPQADATGMHCGGIEIIQGDRTNLRFVNLQDWGRGVFHFAQQKAIVGRDSNLQWTIGAMGSRLAKVNQQVELVGEGASTQVNGTMFTEGSQHLAYNTLQHHGAPNCRSDFLYKAALQDRSRTVWRGLIRVDHGAQKTDGYQRNDNLLLSNKARADSIPGLEIHADDVRCTHGSTSGRVDEELIFYAQCRGFTRLEAIRAIVTGFFQQVYDRVTIESVRKALGDAIARRVRDYD